MSRRRLAGVLAMILVICTAARPAMAAVDPAASFQVDSNSWQQWPQAADIQAKTGVVMEAETGAVLYAKGMDAQRYPASLTKIMTALLLVENCGMDQQITMTDTGLSEAYPGSSNCSPVLGEVFTAEQCLQMILIKSANDVATQTAEYMGGSVQGFADMMNDRAAKLGCVSTHFTNASGLESTADHYTSAHDLALITREAIKNDKFRETFGTRYVTIPATNMSGERGYGTHIMMLDPASPYYYQGCFGGKTGFTDEAQNCLMVCAERNGVTLIGVLMGCADGGLICQEMAKVLDYGFSQFTKIDMTDGLKVSQGGKAMVPAGVSAADVEVREAAGPEGQIQFTYEYGGRILGTASAAEADYTAWQAAQKQAEETPAPAEEGSGDISGSSQNGNTSSETETSGAGRLLYLVMAVLGALILAGIALIFVGAHRNKQYRRKNERK